MKIDELLDFGFTCELTHYQLDVETPMLGGKTINLIAIDSLVEPNKVYEVYARLPLVYESGKPYGVELQSLKGDDLHALSLRNLINWLKVERPDLELKPNKQ